MPVSTATVHAKALVIAHGALGVALLGGNLVLFPPWDSLFYWWLAPFDVLGLLATALLALQPARAWGCLLGLVAGGLESIALLYLAGAIPNGSFLPPLLLAVLALCRLAAVWRLAFTETAERPHLPERGCAS
ncbi:MAG: hypothetical protein ACOCWR_09415 [Oceanidesulfovibrio sp.]